jgi:hypothetical protein
LLSRHEAYDGASDPGSVKGGRRAKDGAVFRGTPKPYRSLSKIAGTITGTPWNGFLFFFGRASGTKNGAEERAE